MKGNSEYRLKWRSGNMPVAPNIVNPAIQTAIWYENSSFHAGTTTDVSINQINVSKKPFSYTNNVNAFPDSFIGGCKHILIVQTKPVKSTTFRCGTQLKNVSNTADVTHHFRTGSYTPRGHVRNLTVFSKFFDMDPHSTVPTYKDFHTL
jgi:hypothetical protein